jgi:hypothetical protein
VKSESNIRKSIKNWLVLFITALILSGITAFALETELGWLTGFFKQQWLVLLLDT